MKDRVGHSPITPASDDSFKHIIDHFIDKKLKEGPQMKAVMQRIINETKVLYEQSMKKSQCKFHCERRTGYQSVIYSTTYSRCSTCQRTGK